MEEKIIVSGKSKENIFARRLIKAGIIIVCCGLLYSILLFCWLLYKQWNYFRFIGIGKSIQTYFMFLGKGMLLSGAKSIGVIIYTGIAVALSNLFFRKMMNNCEITVSNVRITGISSFGKWVEIPLRNVVMIGQGLFSGVVIATASGTTHFWYIWHRDTVLNGLSAVLYEMQNGRSNSSTADGKAPGEAAPRPGDGD